MMCVADEFNDEIRLDGLSWQWENYFAALLRQHFAATIRSKYILVSLLSGGYEIKSPLKDIRVLINFLWLLACFVI